jgi:hypothetical protein
MKILSKTLLVFLIGFAAFSSCKKEEEAKGIDQEMLELARVSTGFTWFKTPQHC